MSRRPAAFAPIGDYAIIGDCHTAALVSRDGSIDWYCPRRFDAPAVFCRLLDAQKGGSMCVAPSVPFTAARSYRPSTNVLESTFESTSGRVQVTDFMPIHARSPSRAGYDVGTSDRIVRRVEAVSGEVELDVRFDPTFDYARARAHLEIVRSRGVMAHTTDTSLVLSSGAVEWTPHRERGLAGRLHLREGEQAWLALTAVDSRSEISEALAYENLGHTGRTGIGSAAPTCRCNYGCTRAPRCAVF